MRSLHEHPCHFVTGTCSHRECRLAALRAAGKARVADALVRNDEARDWLSNWGRMLYDPAEHGRDARRRALAARLIRAMRSGRVGYADAAIAGAWAGALV